MAGQDSQQYKLVWEIDVLFCSFPALVSFSSFLDQESFLRLLKPLSALRPPPACRPALVIRSSVSQLVPGAAGVRVTPKLTFKTPKCAIYHFLTSKPLTLSTRPTRLPTSNSQLAVQRGVWITVCAMRMRLWMRIRIFDRADGVIRCRRVPSIV